MSTSNKQVNDKKTSRLENFFKCSPKTQGSNKTDNSGLSPINNTQTTKKLNMEDESEMPGITTQNNGSEGKDNPTARTSLKQIIGPLKDEVKSLRESFHQDYNNLGNWKA